MREVLCEELIDTMTGFYWLGLISSSRRCRCCVISTSKYWSAEGADHVFLRSVQGL